MPTLTLDVQTATQFRIISDTDLEITAQMETAANWVITNVFGTPIEVTQITALELSQNPTYTNTILVQTTGMTYGGVYQLDTTNAFGFTDTLEFYGKLQDVEVQNVVNTIIGPDQNTTGNLVSVSRLNVELNIPLDVTTIDVSEIDVENLYPIKPQILSFEESTQDDVVYDVSLTKQTSVTYDLKLGPAKSGDFLAQANQSPTEQYRNNIQQISMFTQAGFYMTFSTEESNAPAVIRWSSDMTATENLYFSFQFFSAPTQNDPNINSCILYLDDGVTLVYVMISSTEIRFFSGPTDETISVTPTEFITPIEIIRNVKYGFWSLIVNGEPRITVDINSVTAPSQNDPGLHLQLPATTPPVHISTMSLTSSGSLFSSYGNPVYNVTYPFQGLANPQTTIGHFYTGRGPLVKDATAQIPEPAEVEDVQVYINDIQVAVQSVNPYLGYIELVHPVPRSALGNQQDTIEVDYSWFPNPRFGFSKLNMPGLILNKWNIRPGRNTSSPHPTNNGGSTQGQRFAMCQGLIEPISIDPLHISHRHLGFEDEYTGALNQPMGFVLNAKPHAFSADTAAQRTLWNKSRLNRWNKLSSGEFEKDVTPESVQTKLLNGKIHLRDTHINATRIFYVLLNGLPIAQDEWEFDQPTQTITLFTERPNSPVTVVFSPAKPITNTYIEKQPLLGGVTLLNEGTPPMVKTHSDLYSDLEFMEVDNGGVTKQIAIADDGPYPAHGFREIDIKGRFATEYEPIVKQQLVTQGGGAMGMCLMAAGGSYTNLDQLGHLEGGQWRRNPKITWPLQPSHQAVPSRGIQRTHWLLRNHYEEVNPVHSLSETSCIAVMLDFDGEQRLGPWSDLDALSPESLMANSINSAQEPEGLVLQGGNTPNLPTQTVYTLV